MIFKKDEVAVGLHSSNNNNNDICVQGSCVAGQLLLLIGLKLLFLLIDHLGANVLEAGALDKSDERVELILGLLVLVALAGDADAHTAGHVADTTAPDELVEVGVDANIRCAHLLQGEDETERMVWMLAFFFKKKREEGQTTEKGVNQTL